MGTNFQKAIYFLVIFGYVFGIGVGAFCMYIFSSEKPDKDINYEIKCWQEGKQTIAQIYRNGKPDSCRHIIDNDAQYIQVKAVSSNKALAFYPDKSAALILISGNTITICDRTYPPEERKK